MDSLNPYNPGARWGLLSFEMQIILVWNLHSMGNGDPPSLQSFQRHLQKPTFLLSSPALSSCFSWINSIYGSPGQKCTYFAFSSLSYPLLGMTPSPLPGVTSPRWRHHQADGALCIADSGEVSGPWQKFTLLHHKQLHCTIDLLFSNVLGHSYWSVFSARGNLQSLYTGPSSSFLILPQILSHFCAKIF